MKKSKDSIVKWSQNRGLELGIHYGLIFKPVNIFMILIFMLISMYTNRSLDTSMFVELFPEST